ncbi:LOW QUALITY PROTEIN: tyrosine kinase receptor Cad96Ca-like [Tachypleus tridentatus]|uniref:LOW QUALITY PROTEIN: tyrosine kinase receptor Cad96Ca-like n=1 Tax=Tachypleus tridentatus TaxID=6853 RepID=UPI003FD6A05E
MVTCKALLVVCCAVFLAASGEGFPGHNSPPVFDLTREWLIPENEPVGSRITTVRVRDDEKDDIEYGIKPAVYLDGSSFFRINKRTGDVFLASPVTGEAGNDYYLFITANDGHQTSKIEVYVRILKPNDSPEEGYPIDDFSIHGKPDEETGRRPFPPYQPNSASYPFLPNPPTAVPSPVKPPQRYPPSLRSPPKSLPPPPSITSTFISSSTEGGRTTIRPGGSEEGAPGGSKDEGSQGINITATVLPIVAILGFAPLVAFLFWMFYRKCLNKEKIKQHKKVHDQTQSEATDDLNLNLHPNTLYHQRSRRASSNRYESGELTGIIPEDRKWEFPRHHLRFLGILGEGCFGQVWKCEALNIDNKDGACIVAVKTLKEHASEKEKKDLLSELEVMKLLDPHPNVVTLWGCCTERDPLFVIMEYVMGGKLQSYLRESRAERFYGNLHGTSRHLTSRDLTSFAYQVTKGMEYLSTKRIIHRDLAARNILVDENKTCKVADFGFARDVIVNHVYERKSEGRLPIRWMAPESLFDNIFTTKTDVWSFGILMWEIVTLGSTPYPGMAAAEVMRRVRDGYRLEKPDHCKREMYNIMHYCWDSDPKERPSFSELVCLLDKLLISEHDYIELDRFPDHSYYNITNLSGEKL